MKTRPILALLLLAAGCGGVLDGQYAAHLSLREVAPSEGPSNGGTTLVLHGTRFCNEMRVSVGGATATQTHVLSAENATAVVPAHARGDATVEVTCGEQSARGPAPFRYYVDDVALEQQETDPGYIGYGDVDGDGVLDGFKVVTVDDPGRPSVHSAYELHRGVRQGLSFDPTPFAVLSLPSYDVPDSAGWDGAQSQFKVADFTGDGTLDVMTFSRGPLGIDCRLFAAESGFRQVGLFILAAASAYSVHLLRTLDLDGDGWQDLVIAEVGPGPTYNVSVLHGQGGASFGPRQFLVSTSDWPVEYFDQRWMNERSGGPTRVDFNGDAVDDLLLAVMPSVPSRALDWVFVLGDRDRRYAPKRVPPPLAPESQFGLILPDGEGPPNLYELVLAEPALTSRRVRVWKATGLGEFETTPTEFSIPCLEGLCPELTETDVEAFLLPRRFDLDLDGHGEYAMVSLRNTLRNITGWNFPTWLGWVELGTNAQASFVDSGEASFPGTHGLRYGQFIDSLTQGPAQVLRLVTDAGVRFITPGEDPGAVSITSLPPFANDASSSHCMGDFDGDGLTDVLELREGKGWLLTGRPDGSLVPSASDPIPVRGGLCSAAHFTSPDRTDFYTLDAVYLNQGNGRFLEWLPAFPDTPSTVILKGHPASNRSGLDDLIAFVSRSDSAAEYRLLRASDGGPLRWVDQSRRSGPTSDETNILADLNGDGSLDQVSCSEQGLDMLYGVPGSSDLPAGNWIWYPDAPTACDWISQRVDQQGVFFLLSDGTVVRQSAALHSDLSAGSAQVPIEVHDYTVTSHLVFPSFLAVPPSQNAVCNMRGRGRGDLVFVADGWIGVAAQSEVNKGDFDPIIWWSLVPSGLPDARLVGCGDVDGDGLDDLAVTDGSRHRLFILRNGSH